MRICSGCGKILEDDALFCTECGCKTVESNPPSEPPQEPSSNTVLEYIKKKTEEWDNSDNVLFRWLPSLLSIIGLIVAWEFSILFGLALSVCGIVFGSTTKNKANKIVSLAVGILCILICLVAMFS